MYYLGIVFAKNQTLINIVKVHVLPWYCICQKPEIYFQKKKEMMKMKKEMSGEKRFILICYLPPLTSNVARHLP